MTKSIQGEGEAYFPAPWWSHFATSHQDEAEDEAGGEEEEEEDTEESSEESETEMGQEEEGVEGEDVEEEEVEPEFQLTEDTEDERFKADTLFIIEEVLSRVSSEQRVDEEEVVGEGVECPVEVGRVEETAGEDAGGGVGWQEVEEDEVEEDESTKTKTDAERSAESPADASVEEEESPDEGISSDTSCSEEGVVNEEEEEEEEEGEEGGPVVEEELSEKSEGFFEAIESRSEEYAKLGVVNGLDTRCLTDEDFGESENAAKIANEDTLSA